MGHDDAEEDDVAPNNEQYYRTVVTLAQTANYLPARNNYLRRRFPPFPLKWRRALTVPFLPLHPRTVFPLSAPLYFSPFLAGDTIRYRRYDTT